MSVVENAHYVSQTNSAHLYPDHVHINDLSLLKINAPWCRAVVSLQGAQVLEFQSTDKPPLLWLSPSAVFDQESFIHGGIPVCAPWFGVHADDPRLPIHGFVRQRLWQLKQVDETADTVSLHLEYQSEHQDKVLYPWSFSIALSLHFSNQLTVDMSIRNTDQQAMPVSWALHSYLAVDDIQQSRVAGLQGALYLDNTDGLKPRQQIDVVSFSHAVDRVYESVSGTQTIDQRIQVSGQACPSVIVWNPGTTDIEGMSREDYRHFVCVERGAAFKDRLCIEPGATFESTMLLSYTES